MNNSISFALRNLNFAVCPQKASAEWTLAYLFTLAPFRFQSPHWFQLKSTSKKLEHQNLKLKTADLKKFLQEHFSASEFQKNFAVLFQRKNWPEYFFEIVSSCSWKQLPLSSLKSLAFWQSQIYPIDLIFEVPSPYQLLEMQSRGRRCVTAFLSQDDLSKTYEHERDAFLFAVHDLEHADRFFSNAQNYRNQMTLAAQIKMAFVEGPWQNHWAPSLLQQFEYLISDMNTVPEHSLMTLKHLWITNKKILLGLDTKKKLPLAAELECQQEWQKLFNFWEI